MTRGLVTGFIAGVVVTLILAGSTAYYVYVQIQRRLSSDTTQRTVETRLISLLGKDADLGGAKVTLPNLLTLDRVSISNATGTVLSIAKVEATAEGGISGLQAGRFMEMVLTDPVITLEKRHGRWNVRDLLDPLLAKVSQPSASAPTSASGTPSAAKPLFPLKMVDLRGLRLSVKIENQSNQELAIESLLLTREDPSKPWNLLCKGTSLQIGFSEERFALM